MGHVQPGFLPLTPSVPLAPVDRAKQARIQDSSLGKSDVKEGFLGSTFHSVPLSPKRQLLATCISRKKFELLGRFEGI